MLTWAQMRHYYAERFRTNRSTQTDVGTRSGVGQNAISKLLRNEHYGPSVETFVRAVLGLGVLPSEFFAALEKEHGVTVPNHTRAAAADSTSRRRRRREAASSPSDVIEARASGTYDQENDRRSTASADAQQFEALVGPYLERITKTIAGGMAALRDDVAAAARDELARRGRVDTGRARPPAGGSEPQPTTEGLDRPRDADGSDRRRVPGRRPSGRRPVRKSA